MENARVRAARGAAMLDREMPGWEERIDLGRLDISSSSSCITGQRPGALTLGLHYGGLEANGFVSPFSFVPGGVMSMVEDYRQLTVAWTEEIELRLGPFRLPTRKKEVVTQP